jgi:hypothetical protein
MMVKGISSKDDSTKRSGAIPENLILDKVTELGKVARSSEEILGDGLAVRLISFFVYIFWRVRLCWPLFCLFCVF